MTLLSIDGLSAGYGRQTVLHDVSLRLEAGEAVALVGVNGAGKTTTLRALTGLARASDGNVVFDGRPARGESARRLLRRGIAHVPEGRHLFPTMTVEDNLVLAGRFQPRHVRHEQHALVMDLFPILAEKLKDGAGSLSGGQQQMLAIGRGLMAKPKVLLIDEPSAGLAPVTVDTIVDALQSLARSTGVSLLIAEQAAEVVSSLCDRAYLIAEGHVVREDAGSAAPQLVASVLAS